MKSFLLVIFISTNFLFSCTQKNIKASLPAPFENNELEAKSQNNLTELSKDNSSQKAEVISSEKETVHKLSADTFSTKIPATIKPENQSSLSFSVAGTIAKTYVKPGETVRFGQLLAQLEDTQANLDVKAAQIDVDSKLISLQQQKKKVARTQEQLNNGIVNLAALENEKINLKNAELLLKNSQAILESKLFLLKSTKMFAPYAGVISQMHKSLGDYIPNGTQVFQITQMNNLNLFAQIPITYLNKMKVGMALKIANPISGDSGTATLNQIVQVVDPSTRTFDIYAKVNQFSGTLIPGMFLEISPSTTSK